MIHKLQELYERMSETFESKGDKERAAKYKQLSLDLKDHYSNVPYLEDAYMEDVENG